MGKLTMYGYEPIKRFFGMDAKSTKWPVVLAILCLCLANAVSAEDLHQVEATGEGDTLREARNDAMRSALMATVEQLVASDRLVQDGELLRDALHATFNGFIHSFTVQDHRVENGLHSVRALVAVSETKVSNFSRLASGGNVQSVDGGSLFQEVARQASQKEALENIFQMYLAGFPYQHAQVTLESIQPATSAEHSRRLVIRSDISVDMDFSVQIDRDWISSMQEVAATIPGSFEWRCERDYPVYGFREKRHPLGWTRCVEQRGLIDGEHFSEFSSVCKREHGGLFCISMPIVFPFPEVLGGNLDDRSGSSHDSLSFGLMYAMLDGAGNPLESAEVYDSGTSRCGIIPINQRQNLLGQRFDTFAPPEMIGFGFWSGDNPSHNTLFMPIHIAENFVYIDETNRALKARIPTVGIEMDRVDSMLVEMVIFAKKSRGVGVMRSIVDPILGFEDACQEMLGEQARGGF